jgi:pre-mRNA-splicing helicase BRR2
LTQEPLPPQYFIKLVSDRWIGSDNILPVPFKHLILPEKSSPPTELLDLQPLQVSALKENAFEALYPDVKHFNPIQTQTFSALYRSTDNVLLAAPSGSGKTACGEFAMLKAFKDDPSSRVVYMAPFEALAERRYNDWCKRFGDGFGKQVEILTGENASDLNALERGHIVVTTPTNWDQLSRRWKQRKGVQNVALFLLDKMHLIGSEPGPTLEICCSRMRYIGTQMEKDIRIVGLCNSLSNAKDLGEWIGASSSSIFNFDPGVRPLPLEVQVFGLDIANFEARMQAMSRPAYSATTAHAGSSKQAIVFLPTRKHAKLAALDMLTQASVDEDPYKFLKCSSSDIQQAVDDLSDKAAKYALSYGICLMHDSLPNREKHILESAFSSGAAQLLVATATMCWRVGHEAHLVVIMGTQYYDSSGRGGTDYPITDLVEMAGKANRVEDSSDACKVALFCHAARKEYYKKFLYEALPVESHLNHYLHDHIASEITLRTVENKQDAVDYLTWTFMYRRLMKNPNYYNMTGTSHRHVSDFLSELVESTVSDLEQSKVISVEDEYDLSPLNLGMIAAYYYITYTTVEVFSRSLTSKSKLKGMLDILCSATEFDTLPMRPAEDEATRRILRHSPMSLEAPRYDEPHTKAHAILQAHFSRRQLSGDMALDQQYVVTTSLRLLSAMVDVIASSGWLNPALAAMEMCQMVVQGMWAKESPLMQLPHVTEELTERARQHGIESVFDLLDMDDRDRRALLNMSEPELEEVARVCNRYPSIEVNYEIEDKDNIIAGDDVTMHVSLEREIDEDLRPVDAPRYPKRKDEAWWLVVGNAKSNQLHAIKRITFQYQTRAKLAFQAPDVAGAHELTLFFMCDSYLGCDQELELKLDVSKQEEEDDDGGNEAPVAAMEKEE